MNELIGVAMSKKTCCHFWRFKGNNKIKPYFGCNIVFRDLTLLWINWSPKNKYAKNFTLLSTGQFRGFFIWDSAHTSNLKKYWKYLWPLQSILWFSFTGYETGNSTQCQTQCQIEKG